jgi:hypothetical protein
MAALQSALAAVRGALEGGEPPSPHLLAAINGTRSMQSSLGTGSPGRGVIENKQSTDFESTNQVRTSIVQFSLKVSHALMSIRVAFSP